MRVVHSASLLATVLGCQPPPAAAPAPRAVTVAPPASGEAAKPPAPEAEPSAQPPGTGYLTRDHGCSRLEVSVAEDLLRRGNEAIARAGEHPSPADLDEILPLLHRAAYGGHVAAQRRFGYYVVGYWYTDEMFWPHSEEVAVAALAMLRVVALHELDTTGTPPEEDALLRALASDPVAFDEADGPPPLPEEWLRKASEEARAWSECVQRQRVD